MVKNFKIARKPGQASQSTAGLDSKVSESSDHKQVAEENKEPIKSRTSVRARKIKNNHDVELTMTRKTIEIPTHYFYEVKMQALQRHMLEKELWAEIVTEYFNRHPTA
ncbi:MAG: hypothetical protein ACRD63_09930 [Pyrinomonadaceae bacterium]